MLYNTVLDNGLAKLGTAVGVADKLYICDTEPTTLVEAETTYAKGHDNGSLSIAAPSERGGGGREVVVAAINNTGLVTADGTILWYAIVETGVDLLAVGPITSQPVTNGNTFSLNSFTIGIPDPA